MLEIGHGAVSEWVGRAPTIAVPGRRAGRKRTLFIAARAVAATLGSPLLEHPAMPALCRTLHRPLPYPASGSACSVLALLLLGGASTAAEPAAPAGSTLMRPRPPPAAPLREVRHAGAGLPALVVNDAQWRPEGTPHAVPGFGNSPETRKLPAHCEVLASSAERTAADGQRYAIHLRLRRRWPGTGAFSTKAVGLQRRGGRCLSGSGLDHGYAVLAQDSGHDNARNNDPQRNQELVFGFDPQARATTATPRSNPRPRRGWRGSSASTAKRPRHRYFSGCPRAGRRAWPLPSATPEVFDGIVAAAPGFALPAALAEMWDTQQFGRLVADPATGRVELGKLATASPARSSRPCAPPS